MSKPIRVLYVDDNPLDRELVKDALEKEHGGFLVTEADSRTAFEARLEEGGFDLILTDFNILGFEGLQVLDYIRKKNLDIPVVVVTGTGSEDTAIEALKGGAADYVIKKPKHIQRLPETLQKVLEMQRLEEDGKRNQQLLRESEEKYRALMDHAGDAILLADRDGNLLEANRKAIELTGYSREELSRLNFTQLHPPDEVGRTIAVFKEIVEKGFGSLNDGIVVRKNGTRVFVDISGSAVEYSGKRVIQGIFRDITERKQMEDQLRAAKSLLEKTFSSLIEAVFVIDASDRSIITCNPAVQKIFGYTCSELLGKSTEILHVDRAHFERFAREGDPVLEKEGVYETEYRMRRRDGKIMITDHTVTLIRDEKGRWKNAVSVVRDITERKQAEEVLRQSESDLAEAQRVSQLGSWSFDIATNTVRWSEELYRIFEVEKTAFDNTYETFLSRVHPDDRIRVLQLNAEARSSGEPFDVEYRIIARSGEVKYIREVGYARKDPAGTVSGLFGIAQDITERKRVEEQLKSSREELRALAVHLNSITEEERSRIAREIHDELGQALTGLKIDLSWLAKNIRKNQKSLIEKAESLIRIVDATIESVQRIAGELRPSMLDDLGLDAAIEWQAEAFENRAKIKCELVMSKEEIRLDRDRSTALFRIFQEALTNVARHANATQVRIFLEREGESFVLKVEDNGRGITEKETSDPKSLGILGMRERVLPFGGEVSIRGIPGKETTVTVRMPLSK